MKNIKVFDSQIHKSQKERICYNCNEKICIGENYACINLNKLKWDEMVTICKKCFKLNKILQEELK